MQEVSRTLASLIEEHGDSGVKVAAHPRLRADSSLSPFVSPLSSRLHGRSPESAHNADIEGPSSSPRLGVCERILALALLTFILTLSVISTVVLPNVMSREGAGSYKEFFSGLEAGNWWRAYGRYVRPIREAIACNEWCTGGEEGGLTEGEISLSGWSEFTQWCRNSFSNASLLFGLK